MSVTLARTSFYRLSLGDHRMHKLLTAKTREAATEMGLLDRIKDWFCSGKKKNCLNLMFDLLSNIENFKTEQPEKLEELKSLFRYADPRDLITFWHAHDDQGQSLIGRAVLSSDEESKATIQRCLAVLECFPLPLFDSYQLAALVGCANKGDQSRVLGLALKNNNTEAVKTFESLYRDVLTQYQLRYNNAFDETPMLVDCYVYGSHILHDLSCKLITSTTADQLNAVRCCLDLIKPRKSPKLVDEFSSILEPVVQILGDLFKSALLTDDNPVVLDCIASVLSMVDNNTRAAFAKVYLSNNLRSAITEIALQNTTVAKRQNSLNTFNRIASLFQRFQIPVPVSLWGVNPRSAATHMESLLRFALTSQRYESVSLLLKITNNLDSDPSYVKIIASQAAHLLQLSDFNGLKTLLESGSNVVRKIVLDSLEKDKAKAVEMATYLISQRHWGVIDLIISSRPTTEFSKKLQDTINKDDVVLAAMTQDYLNQHQWDKVLDILSPLPTASKSGLCEAIFRDQTKIAAMFNVRERYFLVSRSLSVLPDDYKEKLIEIILSAPNGSVYLDPTQWSFLTVVSYSKIDDGLKTRLMGKIAAKMNTLPEATQYLLSLSALEIWMADARYLEQEDIVKFILAAKVREGNQGKLTANEHELPFLVTAVQEVLKEEGRSIPQRTGEFMLKNNGFFVQLMVLCTNHQKPSIRSAAEEMYKQYLEIDALKPYAAYLKQSLDLADGIHSRLGVDDIEPEIDSAIENLVQPQNRIQANDRAYIFVCPKTEPGPGGQLYDAVMLSSNDIEGIFKKADYDWPVVTFATVDQGETLARQLHGETVSDTYLQFRVFAKRYSQTASTRLFKKLIQTINLNYVAVSASETSHDYTQEFLNALSVASSPSLKFTSFEDQHRLQQIFGNYLTQPKVQTWTLQILPTLKNTHLLEIYRSYGLSTQTQQDKVKTAQTLFCLATLFCRFSSETMFGESGLSPSAIRFYAAALLNQAHQLAPQVIGADNYLSFMRPLVGLPGVGTTCTDQLSTSMADFIKTQPGAFKKIWLSLKPVPWSL